MQIRIKYSKRKSYGLRVKDGVLTVSAPLSAKQNDINELLTRHKKWIESALKRDAARQRLTGGLTEADILSLKKQALEYLLPLCERYAEIMGVRYKKIRISEAKGRFGSCSSLGNISFSYRLMLYPEPAREYVVVHELAHLLQMNHSPRFYKIVGSVLPDYKERRKLLRIKE